MELQEDHASTEQPEVGGTFTPALRIYDYIQIYKTQWYIKGREVLLLQDLYLKI